MKERSVGIRELKSRLSECVRDVKSGATIVVTEHGRRVARLVPEAQSLDERLDGLRNAGAVSWSGRRLRRAKPDVRPRTKRTVADVLVESRG
jgi:prevent-host-death family protein